MKIKFTKLETTEGEKADGTIWTAYVVHGTKLENGAPWKSSNIFNSTFNADLIKSIKALNQGDRVDVKMKQQPGTKYWNVVRIEPITGDTEVQSATPHDGVLTKSFGNLKTGGRWEPDPNKSRGIALRYAIDSMPILYAAKTLNGFGEKEFTTRVFMLANDYLSYIEGVSHKSNQEGQYSPSNPKDPLDLPDEVF